MAALISSSGFRTLAVLPAAPPSSSSTCYSYCTTAERIPLFSCKCSLVPLPVLSSRRLCCSSRSRALKKQTGIVCMAPEEEKLTRRNPLDFPVEWERPKPGRRPDIFPQFSPMKTPLPPPLPCDPPEEDEEEEEKKEKEEEEEENPETEEPEKPEQK